MLPWVAFNLFVLAMLAIDLGVISRPARAVSLREATLWSAIWVSLSLAFNAGLYFWQGPEHALEFFTAYILEKSLSADNIFVFAVIFKSTAVPAEYQHKVLFWGVLGALVMRGIFIFTGVELVSHFRWVLYIFGIFLFITGARLLRRKREAVDPGRNPVLRAARRVLPITEHYEGARFFLRRGSEHFATPLFLVLLMIETSDVIFASDSIPAIFTVTQDAFVIYTSNVFAILGLRSLYFLLAGAIERFRYLRTGLAMVLMFVGAKMLAVRWVKIPVGLALLVILAILLASILASRRAENALRKEPVPDSPSSPNVDP